MTEPLVVDASALIEALLGTDRGRRARERMRGHHLHAPAHLDAEVLSAFGRLHRADEVTTAAVNQAIDDVRAAPITRHPLAGLLRGAWSGRDQLRLVDALYVELGSQLGAPVLSTDARLARARPGVVLVD